VATCCCQRRKLDLTALRDAFARYPSVDGHSFPPRMFLRFVFIVHRNVLFAQQVKICCLFCTLAMSVLQLALFVTVRLVFLLYIYFIPVFFLLILIS